MGENELGKTQLGDVIREVRNTPYGEVNGQMVVVGKVNKSGGRGQLYIAGKVAIPAVGASLTFTE